MESAQEFVDRGFDPSKFARYSLLLGGILTVGAGIGKDFIDEVPTILQYIHTMGLGVLGVGGLKFIRELVHFQHQYEMHKIINQNDS